MPNADHNEAQALAAEAGEKLRQGLHLEARGLFARAAELERRALQQIPPEKKRTWGILAVSLAALLYKARDSEKAEMELHTLLANRDLSHDARVQLRELLEAVWDEKALPRGFEYSGEEIFVVLRGAEVGVGTAPLDMVLDKATEVKSLVTRTVEMLQGNPFRKRGAPGPDVMKYVKTRATQPTAGSYRFSIKLAAPPQLDLFAQISSPNPAVAAPSVIAETVLRAVALATSDDPVARNSLMTVVPDADYRRAMLKLIRNVIPGEPALRELELAREWKPALDAPAQRSTVVLTKASRSQIARAIKENAPVQDANEERAEVRGVLRAVHLDDDWLLVDTAQGVQQRCAGASEQLDDVVGPMVNRNVIVRGRWRRRYGVIPRFVLDDIELAPEDSTPPST